MATHYHRPTSAGSASVEADAARALRIALRTAIAVLRDRDAAEDVAQDVAIAVCLRREQLRDPQRFDAWVHRIALRDSIRAAQRGQRRLMQPLIEESVQDPGSGGWEARSHQRLLLREALHALPEREHAAVVLRYVHDLDDEQIARVLKCRQGTVRSLLSRARARLQKIHATSQPSPLNAHGAPV